MQNNLFEWSKNKIYFTGLISFLLFSTVLLILNGQAIAFAALNTHHPFLLNVFFINYTFIGDGVFALCLIAALLFYYKKKKEGIAMCCSFVMTTFVVQVIKNITSAVGPAVFFEAGQYLYFEDGAGFAETASFTSAHTATAFAIGTVLVLMMKDKSWQLIILFAATLVGYSRIYLAQHYLIDIILGCITGSVSGIISVYLVKNSRGITNAVTKLHRFNNIKPATKPPAAIQPV